MEFTTQPVCRVGSEGQTLHYTVRAAGATELVAAEGCPEALRLKVAETRQTATGIEADVEVLVLDATPY